MTYTTTPSYGDPHPAEPRSVLVYGTLRPGCANYSLVSEFEPRIEPARLAGWGLYGEGRAFPYACPTAGQSMTGDLLTFTNVDWPWALELMDQLEGVPVHYARVPVLVHLLGNGAPRMAWTYTPAAGFDVSGLGLVKSGDWLEHERRQDRTRARRPALPADADLLPWLEDEPETMSDDEMIEAILGSSDDADVDVPPFDPDAPWWEQYRSHPEHYPHLTRP